VGFGTAAPPDYEPAAAPLRHAKAPQAEAQAIWQAFGRCASDADKQIFVERYQSRPPSSSAFSDGSQRGVRGFATGAGRGALATLRASATACLQSTPTGQLHSPATKREAPSSPSDSWTVVR